MLDFNFSVKTECIFGKGKHHQVGEFIKNHGGTKVLVVYDSGRFLIDSGLLDACLDSIKNAGLEYETLTGILPNPRLSLCYEGIRMCKEDGIDFLLAIGGGSTIDSTKCIAAGAVTDEDVWEAYYQSHKPALKGLPLGVVLTIPATGSETGSGSVITNENGWLKRSGGGPGMTPTFAVLNPELTYTLPAKQTFAGVADMWTHVSERYFTNTPNTYIMDAECEGLWRALREVAPKLKENPNDYDLRSEVMWIGTIAHNNTVGVGRVQDWGTHAIGHEIGGMYDTTHGIAMAIILIAWMKYVYKHDLDRFVRFAKYAMEIDVEGRDKEEVALEAIQKFEDFMKSLDVPTRLSEVNIDNSRFEELADKALLSVDHVGNFVPLYKQDIINILNLAL